MEAMKLSDVVRRVQRIEKMAEDDEVAHSEENQLWEDVLGQIAAGCDAPHLIARAALRTTSIEFARWCG